MFGSNKKMVAAPVLPAIDSSAIIKDLDLDLRAQTTDPPHHEMPTAQTLDANEITAVHRHGDLVGVANHDVGRALARMEVQRHTLRHDAFPDFANAGRIAEQEISNLTHASVSDIADTARNVVTALRAIRLFKLKHGITREARDEAPAMKIAIACASAVVIEGALNMTALAEGMRGGLFQGFATALTLAAANVGTGLAAGFAVRELLHVTPWRRFAGATALGSYLCGLLTWAVLLGHYRHELILHPEAASAAAVTDLTRGLTGAFASIESVMLVGVTIAFGLLAMLSVLLTREPYPGYGRLGKDLAAAKAAHAAVCGNYRRGIDATIAPLLAEVARQRITAIDTRGCLRQHLAAVKAVTLDYRQFLERASRSVDQVSVHYRHVLGIATGIPIPVYRGTYDLGNPIDLKPVLDSVAENEEKLNNPALANLLDRDAAAAMTEIRDVAAKAHAEAGRFFADCEERARGWGPAATSPLLALPNRHQERELA